MAYRCPNCGTFIGTAFEGKCPGCGGIIRRYTIEPGKYSGTITVSGSTFTAYDIIRDVQNMLTSVATSDQEKASYVEPIIHQLKIAAEITKEQEIKLALSQKKDLDEYEKRIQEYRTLIDKNAEEPEFQNFFEENPTFLEPRVKTIFSKKSFGGEGFPDFMLVLHDSSYLIIEIEKPEVNLFNQKGDPTHEFTHAQQQIRNYLGWAIEEKEFLRKRGFSNLSADNIKGLLVIGKKSNLSSSEATKFENINAEVRGRYLIKTFDIILEENETILKNLKKMAEQDKS